MQFAKASKITCQSPFYMVGTIEEAVAKAEKMAKDAAA